MRSLLVSALEELERPVKITEAASGFEALRELPRGDYDLIVTDINMPDINGLELVVVREAATPPSLDPAGDHLDRGLRARSREGSRASAPTPTS